MKGRIIVAVHRAALVIFACALVLGAAHVTTPQASAAVYTRGNVTSTLYLNKQETLDIANAGPFVGAACTALAAIVKEAAGAHPAARILVVGFAGCVLVDAQLAFQAHRAKDRGMCLKIKFAINPRNGMPYTWWPDIYRGKHCV